MTNARGGYRFKHGHFEGKTVGHMMLRRAADLCRIMEWARDKPHLSRLVREFDDLRDKLRNARIVVPCSEHGCKRTPIDMTLPLGDDHYYSPDPSFWCRKHGQPADGDLYGRMSISFDAIMALESKTNRKAAHRSVLNAWGITKPRVQITEKFAHEFFASLD
jgi:hypothetical protein